MFIKGIQEITSVKEVGKNWNNPIFEILNISLTHILNKNSKN